MAAIKAKHPLLHLFDFQYVDKQKEKKEKKSNQKKIERKEKVIVEYKYSPITEKEEEEKI